MRCCTILTKAVSLGSTGRRNAHVGRPQALVKRFGRRLPSKGLTRPGVEGQSDRLESIFAVCAQVGALWKILTQQPVGVLVRAALPWASRLEKVGINDVSTADAPCFHTVAADIDQELSQLCHRFNVLERHIRTLLLNDDQNVWARLNGEQQEIVDKIETLPPKTLFGFQAVARALTGWWPEMAEDQIGDLNYVDANMMIFLLRNLVQMPDTTTSGS